MLDLAKKRSGRHNVVYDAQKKRYYERCDVMSRNAGIFPPRTPWVAWGIRRVHFRRWNEADPVELLAALKWPVDWLVVRGFVENDSSRELVSIVLPTQQIDRGDRCVELDIYEATS